MCKLQINSILIRTTMVNHLPNKQEPSIDADVTDMAVTHTDFLVCVCRAQIICCTPQILSFLVYSIFLVLLYSIVCVYYY